MIRLTSASPELDVQGTIVKDSSKTLSDEVDSLGSLVQQGSGASVLGVNDSLITVGGLSGMTDLSVGRYLTLSGAASSGNNGEFVIHEVHFATQVSVVNVSGSAPDANNGSISWDEREPYTLADDINFERTDRAAIKGVGYEQPIPLYTRPDATASNVSASLANIAGKTTDARGLIVNVFAYQNPVNTSDTFITLSGVGLYPHSSVSSRVGVPCFDVAPYVGDFRSCYVEIANSATDNEMEVSTGPHTGEKIYGVTRAGSSTSPNSVEVLFYSAPRGTNYATTSTPYAWELGQPSLITCIYGFNKRLDQANEYDFRTFKGEQLSASGSMGPPGPTGPQGAQGSPGATGPQGAPGAPGVTGTQGSTGVIGPQGSPGLTGSLGPQGNQGSPGIQGSQGSPGAQGSPGITGSVGATGAQGNQGSPGVTGSQGAQGSPGLTGSIGPQGNQGSPGLQGNQGSPGTTGVPGIQGSPGLQGSPGITGSQGPQGVQGSPGVTGSIGAQGSPGVTGSVGPQGSPGITGSVGPQGNQGIQGSPGVTGAQGALGTQGSPGLIGPQGVQGSPGTTGVQGNQGTQGSPGAQGPTGSIGPQGSPGSSLGITGPAGEQGSPGVTGAQGIQGSPGLIGSQGSPGVTGPQGAQGSPGVTGSIGPQGDQGSPGVTGSIGPQGNQGSPGVTGTQGPTGSQGIQGSPGITGSQGPTGSIGPQGNQGSPGTTGSQGALGTQGSPGIQGPTGSIGATGSIGPQGNQGSPGVTGPQGNQGSPGVTGVQGALGTQGSPGIQGVQGSPGVTGSQGPTGSIGPQGDQGSPGLTGSIGPQGTQGSPGVTGFQGIQGNQGSPGVTGVQGALGTQGSPGLTGSIGPQGNQGSPGVTGTQGPTGSIGPQGNQGSPGVTGVQGALGTQGSPGIQGQQGSPGPTGSIGATGNIGPQGNQGSPGVTGSIGPQGVQGSPGVTGSVGPQGNQGSPGVTGAQGALGTQGSPGLIGPQGIQGSQGSAGVTGPQGAQGVQGSPGVTGVQGSTGSIGPQGVQGSPGVTGSVGPQGAQGSPGVTGTQGNQGSPGVTGPQGATGAQGPPGGGGGSAGMTFSISPTSTPTFLGLFPAINFAGNNVTAIATNSVMNLIFNDYNPKIIIWEESETYTHLSYKLQRANNSGIIYVKNPTGGGNRDIPAGTYDWTNLKWMSSDPAGNDINLLNGFTFGSTAVLIGIRVNFITNVTTPANTITTTSTASITIDLKDSSLRSLGGAFPQFVIGEFALTSFVFHNCDIDVRFASSGGCMFRMATNTVANVKLYDTTLLQVVDTPIFAIDSNASVNIYSDGSTYQEGFRVLSTGAGTAVGTGLLVRASTVFYDDRKIGAPTLINVGSAPTVQNAIDKLKGMVASGVPGPQGSPGVTGPQGAQGSPGIQGNQGSPGSQGDQGSPGVTGPQGATGAQGIQGPPGGGGGSVGMTFSISPTSTPTFLGLFPAINFAGNNVTAIATNSVMNLIFNDVGPKIIIWEPTETYTQLSYKLQRCKNAAWIMVENPSGGGNRDIPAGTYDWTFIRWFSADPAGNDINLLNGFQFGTSAHLIGQRISFITNVTSPDNTITTTSTAVITIDMKDGTLQSLGGAFPQFVIGEFALTSFVFHNCEIDVRFASSGGSMFRLANNAIIDFKVYDTTLLQVTDTPIFAIGSNARVNLFVDGAIYQEGIRILSTGVGTVGNTGMMVQAKTVFYDDTANPSPTFIPVGSAPSVQNALDAIKNLLQPNLLQAGVGGTGTTFGLTSVGLPVNWSTAYMQIGNIGLTTIGTSSSIIMFNKGGLYNISYKINTTAVSSGMSVLVEARLDSDGLESQGTHIPASISITPVVLVSSVAPAPRRLAGKSSPTSDFLVNIPSGAAMELFIKMVPGLNTVGTNGAYGTIYATGSSIMINRIGNN